MTNQTAGENPLKVFGAMLAYYRNRVGMTPEQLGAPGLPGLVRRVA
jgi:hypothetical protein